MSSVSKVNTSYTMSGFVYSTDIKHFSFTVNNNMIKYLKVVVSFEIDFLSPYMLGYFVFNNPSQDNFPQLMYLIYNILNFFFFILCI